MQAGAKLAEFASQQFCTAVACDVAQAVIGVQDGAFDVGHTDDGVLVQGKLLLVQGAACSLALTHQRCRLVDHVNQTLNFNRCIFNHKRICGSAGSQSLYRLAQQHQTTQPARQRHADEYQTHHQAG